MDTAVVAAMKENLMSVLVLALLWSQDQQTLHTDTCDEQIEFVLLLKQ